MKLISACLAGCNCTWRGTNHADARFEELVRSGEAVPVCPEQLGGLCTPRESAEIAGGTGHDVIAGTARVIARNGADVTEQFLRGARETLALARTVRPDCIVLKDGSPSCGVKRIYDGSFTRCARADCGVTAALLASEGFAVISDEE